MEIKFSDQFINPPAHKKQYELVKDYLKQGNTLTTFQAFVLFNIPNLSQRIQDLRNKGYLIDSIPVEHNKRRFVAYSWNENNPTDTHPENEPALPPTASSPVEGGNHE